MCDHDKALYKSTFTLPYLTSVTNLSIAEAMYIEVVLLISENQTVSYDALASAVKYLILSCFAVLRHVAKEQGF